MFSVIFEVLPRKENWDDYLENAKMLVPRSPGGLGHLSSLSVGLRSMEGRHRAPIHTIS
jgi:hypothetical protein